MLETNFEKCIIRQFYHCANIIECKICLYFALKLLGYKPILTCYYTDYCLVVLPKIYFGMPTQFVNCIDITSQNILLATMSTCCNPQCVVTYNLETTAPLWYHCHTRGPTCMLTNMLLCSTHLFVNPTTMTLNYFINFLVVPMAENHIFVSCSHSSQDP